ncbi:MAG: hypothetical protein ACOY71_04160 [Gemmatimonadota bacterium]
MRRSLLLFALLVLAACTGSSKDAAAGAARTERQRDSVLGASKLPGATGVKGSISAQDSARSRNARLDSIANAPAP